MQTTIRNCALCVAFAGALALGSATPSSAAPALGGGAVAKAFAGQQLTDVRWRRGWRSGCSSNAGDSVA